MNFTLRFPPYQLTFPFAESSEPEPSTPWERLAISRSTYFAHRRLRRVAAAAYELGRRRRPVRVPAPAPARVLRPFQPDHGEACELRAVAARVARLTISRREPEKFFEDRSEIVFALRRIAARR
jgi:hypothetical protein